MSELKKYLQEHQSEMDTDIPGERVWMGIQNSTSTDADSITVWFYTKWAVAAAILLIAGTSAWLLLNSSKNTSKQTELVKNPNQLIPSPGTIRLDTTTIQNTNAGLIAQNTVQKNIASKALKHTDRKTPLPASEFQQLHLLENSFVQVINLQKARVSTTPLYAESPEYFNDFAVQMKQMEQDEKAIKADIFKYGLTDSKLDQLINVYQQRLSVLKQLQTEMHKLNSRYKQNRVAVDTAKTYFLSL
ncbi:MAG: hypothetical protein K2Q21_06905 [Chitinophagaceae bacterium]|nr:hypothetical protein [Chitinophagaceae bacterium]